MTTGAPATVQKALPIVARALPTLLALRAETPPPGDIDPVLMALGLVHDDDGRYHLTRKGKRVLKALYDLSAVFGAPLA